MLHAGVKRNATSFADGRARELAASNGTVRTHFLKLVHVAKIGTKPCELESHRLRTNSSHMQPCFSGSLPACAGQAPTHAPHALSYRAAHRPRSPMHTCPCSTPPMASSLTRRSPCVQLIHDACVRLGWQDHGALLHRVDAHELQAPGALRLFVLRAKRTARVRRVPSRGRDRGLTHSGKTHNPDSSHEHMMNTCTL